MMPPEDLTPNEQRVIEVLRKLRPYGKIEITLNQNGSEYWVILTNPQKIVLTEIRRS